MHFVFGSISVAWIHRVLASNGMDGYKLASDGFSDRAWPSSDNHVQAWGRYQAHSTNRLNLIWKGHKSKAIRRTGVHFRPEPILPIRAHEDKLESKIHT